MFERGTFLGQILDIHPATGLLTVAFSDSSIDQAVRISAEGFGTNANEGEFSLPKMYAWGLVTYAFDHPRSGIWERTLYDESRNLYPVELFTADQHAKFMQLYGGQRVIQKGDGTTEMAWRDGTNLQIGTVGTPTVIKKSTNEAAGIPSKRVPYAPPTNAAVEIDFKHSSGARIHISADGKQISVETPGGRKITMDDTATKTTITDPVKLVLDAPIIEAGGNTTEVLRTTIAYTSAGSVPGPVTFTPLTPSTKLKGPGV